MRPPVRSDRSLAPVAAASTGRKWLLFIHQLPTQPSNLRVTTWRRLQHLGALPLKQAVYVLPDTPEGREDFEWLKAEVKAAGGDASVFAADNVESWADDTLIDAFRRSRQELYTALAHDAERALERTRGARGRGGTRAPAVRRLVHGLRERLAAAEAIDFFGSAGRDRVVTLLRELEERTAGAKPSIIGSGSAEREDALAHRNRLWVTRPRPGVDRMASAWLIRRFIDPDARFGFAPARDEVPEGAIPYDMFGVGFSHHGDGCTFETLCERFTIVDPAVARVAAVVHDLDLKDAKFGAPEANTVGALIGGLQLAHADDDELLTHGMALFEALYRSAERGNRTGPRLVGRRRRTASRRRGGK